MISAASAAVRLSKEVNFLLPNPATKDAFLRLSKVSPGASVMVGCRILGRLIGQLNRQTSLPFSAFTLEMVTGNAPVEGAAALFSPFP